jgi:peptidoglycan/xylan/chitin deacetylase (PgdA/CDA1 family)
MGWRDRLRALILLYHRVAEPSTDPQRLAVTPRRFSEHLDAARRWARPIGLGELAEGLRCGDLPARAVVFTFDDGYADNLYAAKPLLIEQGVPATVFVTSGSTGGGAEFWWDELEKLCLRPGRFPEALELRIQGRYHFWKLDGASEHTEEGFEAHRGWTVLDREDPTMRHRIYRFLSQRFPSLAEAERQKILGNLRDEVGAGLGHGVGARCLSADELVRLERGSVVEVGAHTVTHTRLCALSRENQWEEIRKSKEQLEGILHHPVEGFAYPFGTGADYSEETVALVRDAGYRYACANRRGWVSQNAPVFELPRMVVRDWKAEEFSRRLRQRLGP